MTVLIDIGWTRAHVWVRDTHGNWRPSLLPQSAGRTDPGTLPPLVVELLGPSPAAPAALTGVHALPFVLDPQLKLLDRYEGSASHILEVLLSSPDDSDGLRPLAIFVAAILRDLFDGGIAPARPALALIVPNSVFPAIFAHVPRLAALVGSAAISLAPRPEFSALVPTGPCDLLGTLGPVDDDPEFRSLLALLLFGPTRQLNPSDASRLSRFFQSKPELAAGLRNDAEAVSVPSIAQALGLTCLPRDNANAIQAAAAAASVRPDNRTIPLVIQYSPDPVPPSPPPPPRFRPAEPAWEAPMAAELLEAALRRTNQNTDTAFPLFWEEVWRRRQLAVTSHGVARDGTERIFTRPRPATFALRGIPEGREARAWDRIDLASDESQLDATVIAISQALLASLTRHCDGSESEARKLFATLLTAKNWRGRQIVEVVAVAEPDTRKNSKSGHRFSPYHSIGASRFPHDWKKAAFGLTLFAAPSAIGWTMAVWSPEPLAELPGISPRVESAGCRGNGDLATCSIAIDIADNVAVPRAKDGKPLCVVVGLVLNSPVPQTFDYSGRIISAKHTPRTVDATAGWGDHGPCQPEWLDKLVAGTADFGQLDHVPPDHPAYRMNPLFANVRPVLVKLTPPTPGDGDRLWQRQAILMSLSAAEFEKTEALSFDIQDVYGTNSSASGGWGLSARWCARIPYDPVALLFDPNASNVGYRLKATLEDISLYDAPSVHLSGPAVNGTSYKCTNYW